MVYKQQPRFKQISARWLSPELYVTPSNRAEINIVVRASHVEGRVHASNVRLLLIIETMWPVSLAPSPISVVIPSHINFQTFHASRSCGVVQALWQNSCTRNILPGCTWERRASSWFPALLYPRLVDVFVQRAGDFMPPEPLLETIRSVILATLENSIVDRRYREGGLDVWIRGPCRNRHRVCCEILRRIGRVNRCDHQKCINFVSRGSRRDVEMTQLPLRPNKQPMNCIRVATSLSFDVG